MEAHRRERLEAAAQWWARFQESEPPQELVLEWLAWLEEHPDNAQCFEELNELTLRLQRTRELTPERLEALAASPRPDRAALSRRRFAPTTVAIAASLLVALGSFTLFGPGRVPGFGPVATERGTYISPLARQREVVLPDGSRVILGGASRLEMAFSAEERRLRLLAGEAFFEVEHEPGNRPFVVDTGLATVRALGTAFNICRNERRLAVTVTEGRVQVEGAVNVFDSMAIAVGLRRPSITHLSRAEQLIVDDSTHLQIKPADPRRATAWREGRLEFVDEPLDVVLDNVSRYSRMPVRAGDPTLHEITYTGTFVPGQLDNWIDALEAVFGLRVERKPGLMIVHVPTEAR